MKERVVSARWAEAGAKLVDLAEAYPADRFDERPRAEIRSFAEQLRHVAFWNGWLSDTLQGGQPDGAANELPAARYPGKPEILQALRDSFQGVSRALESASDDGTSLESALPILEHVAEHYGQLAVYCRIDGVIPPASR